MGEFPSIARIAPVEGRTDFGLVHRLDTATRGVVVVALTQGAYDALIGEQRAGRFVKEYTAVCEKKPTPLAGFPPCPAVWAGNRCVVESAFRPWGPGGREVRPVTAGSGMAALKKATARVYRTEVTAAPEKTAARTAAGFRHQVRCHLAWLGLPVVGDAVYGTGGPSMLFSASAVFFNLLDTSWVFRL
jgi:23S rRNA pseudouridine1911/1915/1917 synthase